MERKSTGHKDIHHTDIYDGDIIRYKDLFGVEETGEVAFNEYLQVWGVKKYNLDDSFPEEMRKQGYVFGGSLTILKDIEVVPGDE